MNTLHSDTRVPIVKDVSFSVHEKERVGLLGGNDEGKTTILKLLTGELTPDEGNIVKKSGLTLGYLEQSGGFTSDSTVYGAMEELFEEDRRLIARLRETESQMASADSEEMRVLAAKYLEAGEKYGKEIGIHAHNNQNRAHPHRAGRHGI